jgi:hypothetical protein
MKSNMIAGIEVQNISVLWDSIINWLKFKFLIAEKIIFRVVIVITMIINMVWSWKNVRCSILGEFLFCKLIFLHIGIYFVSSSIWLWVCSEGGFWLFHSSWGLR